MSRVIVNLRQHDGAEWKLGDRGTEFLDRLDELEASGCTGRALVEALLGTLWAERPGVLEVSYFDEQRHHQRREIRFR